MGLFDIFGGGDTSVETSSTTTTKPFPGAVPNIDAILGQGGSILGTPLEFFPGDTVADLTPEQLEGLGGVLDFSRNRAFGDIVDPSIDAFSSFINPDFSEFNPVLNALINSGRGDIMETLGEDILPLLGADNIGAAGGGVFDSRNELLRTGAAGEALDAVGDLSARVRGDFTQGLLNRQFAALDRAPGLLDLALQPGEDIFGVGSIFQEQEQNEIDADVARFNFDQNEPFIRASRGSALTLPIASAFSTTESEGTQTADSGGSFFGDILGLGLTLSGLPGDSVGGKLFSKLPGFG